MQLLYGKENNKLMIYGFACSDSGAAEYRVKKMREIPEGERLLYADCLINNPMVGEHGVFENEDKDSFCERVYSSEEVDNPKGNHQLQFDLARNRSREKLWSDFYAGRFEDGNIVRVDYPDHRKYLLLTNMQYNFLYDEDGEFDMNHQRLYGIINVPKSLFVLQALQQGKFSLVENEDISEQLRLFMTPCVDSVSFGEIKKLDDLGLTEGFYDKVQNKIESDRKILELKRSI